MAWTFVEHLSSEPASRGLANYRLSFTDGVQTHTEYWKDEAGLTEAQLVAVQNAILTRLNPPDVTASEDAP